MIKYIQSLLLCCIFMSPFVQAATISGLPNVGNLTINARMLEAQDSGKSAGDFDLQWQETSRGITNSGDSVIAGYFYASQDKVSWGNETNPEIYTKIWFAQSGTLNLNFFHVGLFDVRISSEFEGRVPSIFGGHRDESARISVGEIEWRYARHDYCWGESCLNTVGVPETLATTAACEGLSGFDYNRCQSEQMRGNWQFNYHVLSDYSHEYNMNGELLPLRINQAGVGTYTLMGSAEIDNIVSANYEPTSGLFILIDGAYKGAVYRSFLFRLSHDSNSVHGCYYRGTDIFATDIISSSMDNCTYKMTGFRQ